MVGWRRRRNINEHKELIANGDEIGKPANGNCTLRKFLEIFYLTKNNRFGLEYDVMLFGTHRVCTRGTKQPLVAECVGQV